MTPFYKWFEHDGVRGPNIATVYSDRGYGVRPPVVFYNRSNEAGALLKPGDFDWAGIFGRGVRWFHSGGIFASLSETTAPLIIEGMQAAKASGRRHLVRPQLPRQALGSRRRRRARPAGHQAHRQPSRCADSATKKIFRKAWAFRGRRSRASRASTPTLSSSLIDRVIEQHPNIKLVATTLREVHSTNRHDWAAVLWLDGKRYVSPMRELDVLDRIGGGDGFAAGLIYGLLSGRSPEDALRLGWAHGALLTTFPGDVTMAKLAEVEALAKGGSARVQR